MCPSDAAWRGRCVRVRRAELALSWLPGAAPRCAGTRASLRPGQLETNSGRRARRPQVIRRANDTQYGLACGIFSRNIDSINTLTRGIRAGTVWWAWGLHLYLYLYTYLYLDLDLDLVAGRTLMLAGCTLIAHSQPTLRIAKHV